MTCYFLRYCFIFLFVGFSYSINPYFFISLLISSDSVGYDSLQREYSLFNEVLCFHNFIIDSRVERFSFFQFFFMAFLMHSSIYHLFVVSKLQRHSRMANSRFAIRMFLQFSIDISVVSLINELIRFFHFASNFLNAICFSKRMVSIACFSLFVIIMVSGIVTQFQCK